MKKITTTNGLPRFVEKFYQFSDYSLQSAKYSNQFALTGNNPEFVGDFIVFLEAIIAPSTIKIQNAKGENVFDTINTTVLNLVIPIRLDGGVKISGTVSLVKGFFVPC